MFVQTILNSRQKWKSPLESRTSAGDQEVNKEDTLDECEPASTLILRKEERTAVCKLVKAIALLCSIYHQAFINLVEKPKLSVWKITSGKLYFALSDSAYSLG